MNKMAKKELNTDKSEAQSDEKILRKIDRLEKLEKVCIGGAIVGAGMFVTGMGLDKEALTVAGLISATISQGGLAYTAITGYDLFDNYIKTRVGE